MTPGSPSNNHSPTPNLSPNLSPNLLPNDARTSSALINPTSPLHRLSPIAARQASALLRTPTKSGTPTESMNSPNNERNPLAQIDPNTFSTPVKPTKPEGAYVNFLTNRLERPDLTRLTYHLNNMLGDEWAYSGSVAMIIHATHNQLQDEIHRTPGDADIIIDPTQLERLAAPLLTNPETTDLRKMAGCGGDYFTFLDEKKDNFQLKVDVLSDKKYGAFDNKTTIEGIPVLSLESLKSSKENALEILIEDRQFHAEQSRQNAKDDIDLIKKIMASINPNENGKRKRTE